MPIFAPVLQAVQDDAELEHPFEIRIASGRTDLWTHSRLACVAGLRAVAALPSTGTGFGDCAVLADVILAETALLAVAVKSGGITPEPDDT